MQLTSHTVNIFCYVFFSLFQMLQVPCTQFCQLLVVGVGDTSVTLQVRVVILCVVVPDTPGVSRSCWQLCWVLAVPTWHMYGDDLLLWRSLKLCIQVLWGFVWVPHCVWWVPQKHPQKEASSSPLHIMKNIFTLLIEGFTVIYDWWH